MSLQHLFWKEIAGKKRKKNGQVVGEKGKKKGGPGASNLRRKLLYVSII